MNKHLIDKNGIFAIFLLGLIFAMGNDLPMYADTGNVKIAEEQPTTEQIIDQSTIDKPTIDQPTIDKSPVDRSPVDKFRIDNSIIDTSTTNNPDTSTSGTGIRAKVLRSLKSTTEKTGKFLVHLPRRAGVFTAGVVVGMPLAVEKQTVQDTGDGIKELVGMDANPVLCGALGTVTWPFGLSSGILGGVQTSLVNSWKHCSDEHISRATLGLEETSPQSP